MGSWTCGRRLDVCVEFGWVLTTVYLLIFAFVGWRVKQTCTKSNVSVHDFSLKLLFETLHRLCHLGIGGAKHTVAIHRGLSKSLIASGGSLVKSGSRKERPQKPVRFSEQPDACRAE